MCFRICVIYICLVRTTVGKYTSSYVHWKGLEEKPQQWWWGARHSLKEMRTSWRNDWFQSLDRITGLSLKHHMPAIICASESAQSVGKVSKDTAISLNRLSRAKYWSMWTIIGSSRVLLIWQKMIVIYKWIHTYKRTCKNFILT